MIVRKIIFTSIILLSLSFTGFSQTIGNYQQMENYGNELIFTSVLGQKIRITAYTAYVLRIQAVQKDEDFFADDHYEMVVNHNKTGSFEVTDKGSYFEIKTGSDEGILIRLNKIPMRFEFRKIKDDKIFLKCKYGIVWDNPKINVSFEYNDAEHFCGMGHQAYGLVESIDLKGKTVSCNYGEGPANEWGKQGVLIVPFYLSDLGYGLFLNSTFPHKFIFGEDDKYEFGINTEGYEGRMDFFIILGPDFKDILDRYTKLTGRPRFPQRSIFGLQLSDKGDPDNNGEEWWKNKITTFRKAGFPFDHIVNDNRWRAGTGAWSGSWFEWDKERYPDPAEYATWCKQNNVTMTLDLNRNNASSCWGWKSSYNLPQAKKYVKEGYSAPDYSNPEVRKWVWNLFWKESFNPALNYPGDALWIDETDEMNTLPDSIICADGRCWGEDRNYYHFLIAKAIVQEGWDNQQDTSHPGIGEAKRPFVWMRGMTAGAQRYATYWTGDIKCDYEWMKKTVRAMQTAGLAGLPYFNHDAGGYREPGPDDMMYIQWSMAFGSFSPVWRPHGPGTNKRWAIDRSLACQNAAMKYGKLRYEMMPYLYTYAYNAHKKGMPIARAMVIDYQNDANAWKYDLQYLWGNEMLIAPNCSPKDTTLEIWLPEGQNWYGFWDDNVMQGNQVLQFKAKAGELPIFVKEGAIVPEYNYAQSTFTMDPSVLILQVYTGKNGQFELYEDDGITEKFETKNQNRTTDIVYRDKANQLVIKPANGTYNGAPDKRSYMVYYHGMKNFLNAKINNEALSGFHTIEDALKNKSGFVWDKNNQTLVVITDSFEMKKEVNIKLE